MTWIDAVIIIVFLYFIITAFTAGFIREVISTAAAVLGVVVAGLFYDNVRDSLLSSIDNERTASIAAFLIIFLGITLAGQLLGMVVHPAITVLQLGIFDQLLGAIFGAAKAFVLVEVMLILFITYPRWDLDKKINDSQFASVMVDASAPVLKVLPDVFHNRVNTFKG